MWDGRRETFGEYNAAVNRTAHALLERGVQRGDRIAVLSHNCREFVVVYFALARLGAISVPINFMLNADEVAFILDHSGATRRHRRGRARPADDRRHRRSAAPPRRPCAA